MAHFIMSDGEKIEATNAADLVRQMHERAHVQAADDKAYMMDVSERTVLQCGSKIRYGSHEEFVNDLLKHGLIQSVTMPIASLNTGITRESVLDAIRQELAQGDGLNEAERLYDRLVAMGALKI